MNTRPYAHLLLLLLTLLAPRLQAQPIQAAPPQDWSKGSIVGNNEYLLPNGFRLQAPARNWRWEGPESDTAGNVAVRRLFCNAPQDLVSFTLTVIDVKPEGDGAPKAFIDTFLESSKRGIASGDFRVENLKLVPIPGRLNETYRFTADVRHPDGHSRFWRGNVVVGDRYYILQFVGTRQEEADVFDRFANSLRLIR